jgi:putative intracellular protease/amidase
VEEIATPYYMFKEAGYEVIIASPNGGAIPIDAGSMAEGFLTQPCKKFLHDANAVGQLSHSVKLDTLSFPGDVDLLYMPGGHGACVDFINNPSLKKAIEDMYNAGKLVSTVCHGPMCLIDCTKADGSPLVKGLEVTGFADSEEEAVGKVADVPFLLESKLKELGGDYEKGADWNSKVCVDGNLITGQNPQSSGAAAVAAIAALSA